MALSYLHGYIMDDILHFVFPDLHLIALDREPYGYKIIRKRRGRLNAITADDLKPNEVLFIEQYKPSRKRKHEDLDSYNTYATSC